MGDIFRIRVTLDYANGGPGLNTFHFNSGVLPVTDVVVNDTATAIRTFYDSIKAYMAQGTTVTVPRLAETIESDTGIVDGAVAGSGAALTVAAGDASSTSRATQMYIGIKTGTIRRRRLMRGGLFIGPLGDAAIQTNGAVLPAAASTVLTACGVLRTTQFVAGNEWLIWGRPVLNSSGGVVEAGVTGAVASFAAKSNPGVLRSRRD